MLYGKPLQQVGALVLAERESERAGVLRRRFAVRSQARCSQPGRWRELDDGGPVVGVLGELGKSGEVLIGPTRAQRIENLRVQPPPVPIADAGQDGLTDELVTKGENRRRELKQAGVDAFVDRLVIAVDELEQDETLGPRAQNSSGGERVSSRRREPSNTGEHCIGDGRGHIIGPSLQHLGDEERVASGPGPDARYVDARLAGECGDGVQRQRR
jgi:hypothetical protein